MAFRDAPAVVQDPLTVLESCPLLDAEQMEILRESGGDMADEMIRELVELFQSEAEPRLAEVAQLADAMDREKFSRHMHALAGSSANLGGLRLSRLCRTLEAEAAQAEAAWLADAVGCVQNVYAETLRAFDASIA